MIPNLTIPRNLTIAALNCFGIHSWETTLLRYFIRNFNRDGESSNQIAKRKRKSCRHKDNTANSTISFFNKAKTL